MQAFYIVQLEPKHDPLRIKFGMSDDEDSKRELAARTYCPYAEVLRLYRVPDGVEMESIAESIGRQQYGASRPGQSQVRLQDCKWLPRNRRLYASMNGKTRVAKDGVGKELLRFKSYDDLQDFLRTITNEVRQRRGRVIKSKKPVQGKSRAGVTEEAASAALVDNPTCPCGSARRAVSGRYGWFLSCSTYPDCKSGYLRVTQ